MAELSFDRISLAGWTATAAIGTMFAAASSESPWTIAIGATLLALAQLVRVPTPSDDYLDLGLAVAAAVPLLVDEGLAVGAIYALGLLAARLVVLGRRGGATDGFLANALALALYGMVFLVVRARLTAESGLSEEWIALAAVLAGGAAWFVTSSIVRAAGRYQRERFALRYLWLSGLEDWPAVVGLISAGALFAFAFPTMRWWAVPMSAMAYGFSHLAFVRYAGTRLTYGQTIRALATIPEVAKLAPEGHSTRTAALARAIGQDLGLGPNDVTGLEYAALMHDIGRITLNEPAILKAGYTDHDIARWGAEIISEAPYLDDVAEAVLQQHNPYRRPGEEHDETLPMASKVIRVASAYDQAVTEMGLIELEAVELLHRGAAYDFDPRVVSSLRRVVARQGHIAY
ncbi:MAG: HD domain-containing protein [Acidimicrobiia bacterium]|nr:HD domain-containing protein [Acidimicrobiia bacterium]